MSFAVVWNPDAIRDIDAACAVASPEFTAVIEDAIDQVIQLLSAAPDDVGESRGSPDNRIVFATPLVLYFAIDRERSLVRVLAASVEFPFSS